MPSIANALWPTVLATLAVGVALGLFKVLMPTLSVGVFGLVIGFTGSMAIFLCVLYVLIGNLGLILEIGALLTQLFPREPALRKGSE